MKPWLERTSYLLISSISSMTACSALAIGASRPCSALEIADNRRSRDLDDIVGGSVGRRNRCEIELVRRFISL